MKILITLSMWLPKDFSDIHFIKNSFFLQALDLRLHPMKNFSKACQLLLKKNIQQENLILEIHSEEFNLSPWNFLISFLFTRQSYYSSKLKKCQFIYLQTLIFF